MDKDKLSILHGTINIANQMVTLVNEIKRRRYFACSLNYYPNYLSYDKTDYTIDINIFSDYAVANDFYKQHMRRFIDHFDIFHFHFGTTLTLDGSDLPLLYEKDKKIFMHHWGSDVRLSSLAKKYNPFVVVKNDDEISIISNLKYMGKYIKTCFVADYELFMYVKDFYENVIILPQAIDLEKYKFSPLHIKNKEKIKIVHAPTDRLVKGTKYIINAVSNLSSRYKIELILVERLSHQKALEIYKNADLVIDQMCLGTYGLLAIEAMAMGKPVITYLNEHYREYYPKELPIISADPTNIEQVLKEVLDNFDMLEEVSIKSREYVEKYHNVECVVDKLISYYFDEK